MLVGVCSLELKQLSGVKKISPVGWKVVPRKQSKNEPYVASQQMWEPNLLRKKQIRSYHFHFPADVSKSYSTSLGEQVVLGDGE